MKHLNRFLCFFMCFCLCFAWFGPPIEAEAVGIGYALYVLIIWMASFGVSFVGSDIAEIWDHVLEDWVRDYLEYRENLTIDDFYDGIMKDVVVNNQGYIVVGVTAASLMSDFMAWLRDVKMVVPGNSVDVRYGAAYLDPSIFNLSLNGASQPLYLVSDEDGYPIVIGVYERLRSFINIGSSLYPGDSAYIDSTSFSGRSNDVTVLYTSDNLVKFIDDGGTTTCDLNSFADNLGYSISNIVCLSWILSDLPSLSSFSYCLTPCVVFSDGYVSDLNTSFLDFYSYSSYLLSDVYDASVEVDDDGFKIPDPSSWPVGFSGYTMNTGTISGSTIGDIANQIDQQLEIGDLTVSPELNTVETDGSSQGTLMGIFNLLKALPQTLANLILDGIKSIFIPDPEHLEGLFMDLLENLNDTYKFDFDLGALFAEGRPPDNINADYSVGSKVIGMTFVNWEFLIEAVDALRKYIRGFIVVMLVFFNLRQFMAVLNMVSLESDGYAPAPEASTSLVVYKGR